MYLQLTYNKEHTSIFKELDKVKGVSYGPLEKKLKQSKNLLYQLISSYASTYF